MSFAFDDMPCWGSVEWRLMLLRIGAAALSGLLFWFTLGLTPVGWAAWLAPIPLLWAVLGAGREARWLCYGAALIGLSGNFSYYLAIHEIAQRISFRHHPDIHCVQIPFRKNVLNDLLLAFFNH